VPEEADAGADNGAAEDGELADQGHALQLEVVGEDDVAADVGEHGERAGGDDGAADGQAVEAVGEVDGVAGAGDDDHHEEDEGQKVQPVHVGDDAEPVPGEVGTGALGEGEDQAGGVVGGALEPELGPGEAGTEALGEGDGEGGEVVAVALEPQQGDGDGGADQELQAELLA